MYELSTTEAFERTIAKLQKKDKIKYEQVKKKILQICENPYQGKPLRNVMKGKWRVHIGEHVITYAIDESAKTIKVIDYDHHDNVYE